MCAHAGHHGCCERARGGCFEERGRGKLFKVRTGSGSVEQLVCGKALTIFGVFCNWSEARLSIVLGVFLQLVCGKAFTSSGGVSAAGLRQCSVRDC